MKLPKFVQSLQKLKSDKMIVTILTNKELKTQPFTGIKFIKPSYRGCEIITTNKLYYKSLCNTFGVKSERVIYNTFDHNEISFVESLIPKYNITLRLV